MSTLTICPQEIRIANHKEQTAKWWQDPVYSELSDNFLKNNKECEYCGRKSTVVHHDNAKSYRSQEEYYKPENFTACCARCHQEYRKGDRVICPVCRQHYMKRDADKCRWCRGMPYTGRKSRHPPRHPCGHRVGQQRCQRNGRLFVCGTSSRKARDCEHFEERVKAS